MFDFSQYAEAELVPASIPLSLDQITDYFSVVQAEGDARLAYALDYSTSGLKGKQLMTYLSNLEIPSIVMVDLESPYEERAELMKAYMSTHSIVECPALAVCAAQLLMLTQGTDEFEDQIVVRVFSMEEAVRFIEENDDLIARWSVVMSSMMVFTAASTNDTTLFDSLKPKLRRIDDARFVGKNFVNLFAVTPFVEMFYRGEPQLFYFDKQFEEPMFASKKLITWFAIPSNPLLFFMEAHTDMEQLWHSQFSK